MPRHAGDIIPVGAIGFGLGLGKNRFTLASEPYPLPAAVIKVFHEQSRNPPMNASLNPSSFLHVRHAGDTIPVGAVGY